MLLLSLVDFPGRREQKGRMLCLRMFQSIKSKNGCSVALVVTRDKDETDAPPPPRQVCLVLSDGSDGLRPTCQPFGFSCWWVWLRRCWSGGWLGLAWLAPRFPTDGGLLSE